MNKSNIPKSLHHLIPLVNKWGISDDSERDILVENSKIFELKELSESISDANADTLDEWLYAPPMLENPSFEYIKYSNFFMAFEYARVVLKNKRCSDFL